MFPKSASELGLSRQCVSISSGMTLKGSTLTTEDFAGENLPVSLTGVGWTRCGIVPNLGKLFPTGQAQAIQDVVRARGFYLFKFRH